MLSFRSRALAVLTVPLALAACASHAPHVASPPPPGPGWRYEVALDTSGRELSAQAIFPAGSPTELYVESPAEAFVRDVEIFDASTREWKGVPRRGPHWSAPACASGCTVRYRFELADAAKEIDDIDRVREGAGVTVSTPSAWLLRPFGAEPRTPATFHVTTPPDIAFVSGVFPDSSGVPDTYHAIASDLELAPYSVFGTLRTHRIHQDGATLQIAIAPGELAMNDDEIDRWVSQSARAVTSFYHRFPLSSDLLVIMPSPGREVRHGRTLAGGGATVLLDVGEEMTAEDIPDDWVLTHELTHLAFPSLAKRYSWLEEGLATYVEPIARARIGIVPTDEVWRGLVLGLPKGLPRPGDRGLDHTKTWGRTYWGGALFCLVADILIRNATANQKGLEDALRGILDAGGNDAVRWDLERALEAGDRATGVHVLRDLHTRMGSQPVEIDLPSLWRQLGVQMRGRSMSFDETAPLSSMRRAITVRDATFPPLVAALPTCSGVNPPSEPCLLLGR